MPKYYLPVGVTVSPIPMSGFYEQSYVTLSDNWRLSEEEGEKHLKTYHETEAHLRARLIARHVFPTPIEGYVGFIYNISNIICILK